jgi:hypothetical protein
VVGCDQGPNEDEPPPVDLPPGTFRAVLDAEPDTLDRDTVRGEARCGVLSSSFLPFPTFRIGFTDGAQLEFNRLRGVPSPDEYAITPLDPSSNPGASFSAFTATLYRIDSADVTLPIRFLLYGEGSLRLLSVDTSGTTTGRFTIDEFRSFQDTTLRLGIDGVFNAECTGETVVPFGRERRAERAGRKRSLSSAP